MIDFRDLPKRYSRYYTYLEPIMADPLIRGYFSLVASFFLVAFFIFFALSPTINTIISLQKKISDEQSLLLALQTKKNNLIIAQQNYSQVEKLIPTLILALPKKPTPQTVISEITSQASASGVTVSGLSFGKFNLIGDLGPDISNTNNIKDDFDLSAIGVSNLNVSFSVNGTKEAVRQYLGNLENSLRYLRIRTIGVTVTPGVSDKITVDARSQGYYYVGG